MGVSGNGARIEVHFRLELQPRFRDGLKCMTGLTTNVSMNPELVLSIFFLQNSLDFVF